MQTYYRNGYNTSKRGVFFLFIYKIHKFAEKIAKFRGFY